MVKWSIRCFVEEKGNGSIDVIDAWYEAQPEELQAKFDTRIRYLREQPPANWTRPYFSVLERECDGLGEIRFEFRNIQYRPLGFFSAKLEFVLLLVPTKKGDVFDPRNACELGLRRKELVRMHKERYSHVCEF